MERRRTRAKSRDTHATIDHGWRVVSEMGVGELWSSAQGMAWSGVAVLQPDLGDEWHRDWEEVVVVYNAQGRNLSAHSLQRAAFASTGWTLARASRTGWTLARARRRIGGGVIF